MLSRCTALNGLSRRVVLLLLRRQRTTSLTTTRTITTIRQRTVQPCTLPLILDGADDCDRINQLQLRTRGMTNSRASSSAFTKSSTIIRPLSILIRRPPVCVFSPRGGVLVAASPVSQSSPSLLSHRTPVQQQTRLWSKTKKKKKKGNDEKLQTQKQKQPHKKGKKPPPKNKKLSKEEQRTRDKAASEARARYKRAVSKKRLHPAAKWKRILSACDYWFSRNNLRSDEFMRNALKQHHGWLPIRTLLTYPKLQHWTDAPLLLDAFTSSAAHRYVVTYDRTLHDARQTADRKKTNAVDTLPLVAPAVQRVAGRSQGGGAAATAAATAAGELFHDQKAPPPPPPLTPPPPANTATSTTTPPTTTSTTTTGNNTNQSSSSSSSSSSVVRDMLERHSDWMPVRVLLNVYTAAFGIPQLHHPQSSSSSSADDGNPTNIKNTNINNNKETTTAIRAGETIETRKVILADAPPFSAEPSLLVNQVQKEEKFHCIVDDDDNVNKRIEEGRPLADTEMDEPLLGGARSKISDDTSADQFQHQPIRKNYDDWDDWGNFPDDKEKKFDEEEEDWDLTDYEDEPDEKNRWDDDEFASGELLPEGEDEWIDEDANDEELSTSVAKKEGRSELTDGMLVQDATNPFISRNSNAPQSLNDAFVRHRRVNLEYIELIEQELLHEKIEYDAALIKYEEYYANNPDAAFKDVDEFLLDGKHDDVSQQKKRKEWQKEYTTKREVTILRGAKGLDKFCDDLIRSARATAAEHNDDPQACAIGFDAEYCTLELDIRNTLPAMIQLCAPSKTGPVGLLWLDKFPDHGRDVLSNDAYAPLTALLADPTILKVGVGASFDVQHLARWWGINDKHYIDHFFSGVVDMEEAVDENVHGKSLQEMSDLVLKRRLPKMKGKKIVEVKGRRTPTAHWRTDNMTAMMKNYAVNDAACAIDIWMTINGFKLKLDQEKDVVRKGTQKKKKKKKAQRDLVNKG